MDNKTVTVSLDPNDNSIDSSNMSPELKQMFKDIFVTLVSNPIDISGAYDCMTSYYVDVRGADINPATLVKAVQVLNVVSSPVITGKNVVQINMDGEIRLFDKNPNFSDTKSDAKEILGSVEKIGENELLIADSINKRAIIVDTLTGRIIWEYLSDRYIVDAHIIISDIATISIESSYVNGELTIGNNQTVVWQNNTSYPLTIYSGDISNIDTTKDFSINEYGLDFKSSLLNVGERYSYKFSTVSNPRWFAYPGFLNGQIIVSSVKVSEANQFILTESDSLESMFSSRVIKIDAWGNKLAEFGNKYLVKPRDARSLLNGKVLIST